MLWRIVPIVIIIFAVVWFTFYKIYETQLKNQTQQQLLQQSTNSAQIIASRLQNLQQSILQLAQHAYLVNSLIDFDNRSDYLPAFLESLKLSVIGTGMFTVLDYEGKIVHSSGAFSQKIDAITFNEIMRNGRIFRIGQDGLTVGASILYNDLHEGALVAHYDFTQLQSLLAHPVSIGRYMVLDKDDNILLGSLALEKQAATVADTGNPTLWSYQNNLDNLSGLRLVNYVERDTAIGTLTKKNIYMIAITILAFIIVMGAVIVSVLIVGRPLSDLGAQVMQIKKYEDLNRVINVVGPLEIQEIAQSLNDAHARIKRHSLQKKSIEKRLRQSQKYEILGNLATDITSQVHQSLVSIGQSLKTLQRHTYIIHDKMFHLSEIAMGSDQHDVTQKKLRSFIEDWQNTDFDKSLLVNQEIFQKTLLKLNNTSKDTKAMRDFVQGNKNDKVNISLSQLVEHAMTLSKSVLQQTNRRVRIKLHDNHYLIKNTKQSLMHVLVGLIINANDSIKA